MRRAPFQVIPPVWLICIGAVVLVILNAWTGMARLSEQVMQGDNDDLMRLVVIRDWLAGQNWFDHQQYRVLPPEGISLHWSRYIDAGIAAILVPASWFLPQGEAELLAMTVWPVLLACLMILLTALGTARLFGTAAAVGAVVMALTWRKFVVEFAPGRIDHHNMQILCATAVFFLAVLPGRPRLYGALAGVAAAFSFAIGLEMLPVLLLIWAMVTLRWVFGGGMAGRWLAAFALAIGLAAPLLMAGQVPARDWGLRHCDVLATPLLSLLAVGATASLLPLLPRRWLPGWPARLAALTVVAGLGLALAWPLLGPCLAGPYADVTPEARRIIDSQITEARSVPDLLRDKAPMVIRSLLPVVLTLAMALVVGWRMRARLSPDQRFALTLALVVAGVGMGFALTQIRAANLMAPVVPLLAGVVVGAFAGLPRDSRLRAPAAVMLLLSMPLTIEAGIVQFLRLTAPPAVAGGGTAAGPDPAECRNPESMAEIAALPPSTVFSGTNLGTAIIAYTPHSATSAPYHRSDAAFLNGSGAFTGEAELRAAVAASGAAYLALCRNGAMENGLPYARKLLTGDLPPWLVATDYPQQQVILLEVDKAALAGPAEAAP
ncbi:hypothetical protein [Pseudogemmobacter humi]|uniref:Glycosyltransferase RgtA/B/C/D-like domain-containing protein n=1 Tax=Pseudogemmobacter humi TaxID=2483812 RepID=A0A3P5WW26_9RHOB|nr:hypothetical protein [Pseudogemmobacter humi]VDC20197.1 hypothetical protein XINFAN_00368 [Pseudogemmobacter humi]